MSDSICEIVRKNEQEYTRGTTQISKYVEFSMYDTLARIDAYLNSKHISGETDSLGREKPFFNISVAAANVWWRATDIDRSNIRLRATKSKDWIDSFVANIHLQDWMKTEYFGHYLNEWGRVLARYGSAVTKFVKNRDGLHINVISWGTMICDAIDFDSNPKIEVLDLTEADLYTRIQTHGYNKDAVDNLMTAITTRETLDKKRKDNKSGYIRVYEIHGNLSKATLKKSRDEGVTDDDCYTFTQQMQVIAYMAKTDGRKKNQYDDFILFAGPENKDPYRIDHLIKEDGRSLARGAVENMFESQWMENHAQKSAKDTLDIASRLFFQTADATFLNMNVIDNLQSGDILIHNGSPLTQVNTAKYDVTNMLNFGSQWKALGNEINGISEAMLGAAPKSGTAWRQTQASLSESYTLFQLMTENKGLAIEEMMREWIIPYLKTQMDTSKEVSATLEDHDITRIDSVFMKNEAIKNVNKKIMDEISKNLDRIELKQAVHPIDAGAMYAQEMQKMQASMSALGSTRFFKPSELSDKTWNDQFENLDWELEVDVTGENTDKDAALDTLNTALQTIMNPGFEENKRAQAVVGKILELTGTMSPVEFSSLPDNEPPPSAPPAVPTAKPNLAPTLSTEGGL